MKKYFFILSIFLGVFLYGQETKENQNKEVQNDVIFSSQNEDSNSQEKIENVAGIVKEDSASSLLSKENKDLDIKVPKNFEFHKKNHFLAVYSNLLIPGLGHAYLKDYRTAGEVMGSYLLGYGATLNKHTKTFGLFAVELALFYEFYASYRDLRIYNKNIGYSYKMPTDSFMDLCIAPFNYKVLKKPEVWGGLLADFAVVVGLSYLADALDKKIGKKSFFDENSPLFAFPIGISEESLFRGYLQSTLAEAFNPSAGIVISSLAFGAAHIPNAYEMDKDERKGYYMFAIPFITLSGAYYGWVTYRNHSLKESVALHAWYDFAIFALEKIVDKSVIPTAVNSKPTIAFAFDF